MKKSWLFQFVAAFTIACTLTANNSDAIDFLKKKRIPAFTENKGQVLGFDRAPHPEVRYVCNDGNAQVFLLNGGIAYQFKRIQYPAGYLELKHSKQRIENKHELLSAYRKQITTETFRMDMTLVGADPDPRISAEDKNEDVEHHAAQKLIGVSNYKKVVYHDVYPGIDWVIYSTEKGLKYDFIVHPGADPALIKMAFSHHEEISLNDDGSFLLKNRLGSISEQRPVSYQESANVETDFILRGNVLSFRLKKYDSKKTLLIDPALSWITNYGGSDVEDAMSCATDQSGNVYMCGTTESYNNIANGGHQVNKNSYNDAYLVKFNSAGTRVWGTYFGGEGDDEGLGCATDGTGAIYLCGSTLSYSNIAKAGFSNSKWGSTDAFLAKFDPNGSLIWSTYYGGFNGDYAQSCATDLNNNVFMCGFTWSSNNISSSGHQNSLSNGGPDAFLVKFNSTGARQWGTYYGGAEDEYRAYGRFSCATDHNGNVFLCGPTESKFNIAVNGHQNTYGGGWSDGFLVKFNPNGGRLWGTYYGGSQTDGAYSCAVDPSGNVFLVGATQSTNNIFYAGHFEDSLFYEDGFVVKFSSTGTRYWGTYFASGAYGCTTDQNGNLYVVGLSYNDQEVVTPEYYYTYGSSMDGFLVQFDGSGLRNWGLYSGEGYGCALDQNKNIFVAGVTTGSFDFATGHQNYYGGGMSDGFLARYCANTVLAPASLYGSTTGCVGSNLVYSVTADPAAISYDWELPLGWTGSSTTYSILATPLYGGNHTIKVSATSTCGVSAPAVVNVSISFAPYFSISSSEPFVCDGITTTLSVNGPMNYTWTGGPTNAPYVVKPSSTTIYTVSEQAGPCLYSATYTLNVDQSTAFNYTVNGKVLNLSINSNNCNSFVWDYGNGSGSTLNPSPVVTYAADGTYGVCLRCTQLPNACTKCINIKIPGNGSGGVGITEVTAGPGYEIFPNPHQGEFEIVTSEVCKIEVTNSMGQLMFQNNLTEGTNKIDMQQYAKGVYFVTVKQGNVTSRQKVVKN